MLTYGFVLNNQSGLHARPASLFVKETNKYKSSIKVLKDAKEYNAKSILSVLSMGAVKGTELKIIADGADEKEAIESIQSLADHNFGE